MRLPPVLLLLVLAMPVAAQDAGIPVPRPRPEAPAREAAPVPAEAPAEKADKAPAAPEIPEAEEAKTPAPAEAKPAAEAPAEGPPLPRPRPEPSGAAPDEPADAAPEATPTPQEGAPGEIPETTPAPPTEPRIYQTACPALLSGQVEGKALPPLSEGQCGTQSPLSVTGLLVNGRIVPLTGGAVLTCGMATALPVWVSAVDSYVRAQENTEITEVTGGTSYMCRNVNNAATGNLSDHAFADALDVVGFKLKDGRTVTVEKGWNAGEAGGQSLIRYAHDAACSQFMTVLGPEANALHRDHLHVDLLCHGKSCTARLCE